MQKTEPNRCAAAADAPASNITPLRPTPRRKLKGANEASGSTHVATEAGAGGSTAEGSGNGTKPAAPAAVPIVVVFGRDEGGKAHASSFGAADEALAIKAASLMGFHVLPITTDDHRAAAAGVAAGRVFASGKGFVPFCSESTYTGLAAFPEAYRPVAPVEAEPEPLPAVAATPQRWEDIGVGALVLASENPEEGWFAALIVEDRTEGLFVLRWRDWPDEPAFVRNRDRLSLLPAAAAA